MTIKKLKENKVARNIYTLCCVVLAGFMQAFIIKTFMNPMNLLSSGFTGVAILIDKATTTFLNFSIPTSIGMLVLNIPVAIICSKSISRRFTIFSLIEVFTASMFLNVIKVGSLFADPVLNIVFGGFFYGIMTVIALKANASTGGTDFIALYVSNKIGKSIWTYVFIFNCIILGIFGFMFGWEYAGYSILFQFISTRTIDTFYNRYVRITMQITTSKPDEIIHAFIQNYRHGISRVDGVGGYSGKEMSLLHTVVSGYETDEIVQLLKKADPHVIINTFKTESFYGGFYMKPID